MMKKIFTLFLCVSLLFASGAAACNRNGLRQNVLLDNSNVLFSSNLGHQNFVVVQSFVNHRNFNNLFNNNLNFVRVNRVVNRRNVQRVVQVQRVGLFGGLFGGLFDQFRQNRAERLALRAQQLQNRQGLFGNLVTRQRIVVRNRGFVVH